MQRWGMIGGAMLLLAAMPARADEPAPIGMVKNLQGQVEAHRGDRSVPLAAGAEIFAGDQVRTGENSTVGLTFRDDTTLSMGEKGRMVMDSLVFDPAAEKLAMDLRLQQGSFAVQAGQIARLAPDHTQISTPVMSIGIRGTRFVVTVEGDDGE